jgi:coenzyme Q-binding protein COQ10
MTVVRLKRRMSFLPADVYGVVADVASYEKFLPLCEGSRTWDRRVDEKGAQSFKAELSIGYPRLSIHERFACDVVADPAAMVVRAVAFQGPLKHLENTWWFRSARGETDVEFHLDYEMSSRMLQMVLSGLFDYAARRMMAAFEDRLIEMSKGAVATASREEPQK